MDWNKLPDGVIAVKMPSGLTNDQQLIIARDVFATAHLHGLTVITSTSSGPITYQRCVPLADYIEWVKKFNAQVKDRPDYRYGQAFYNEMLPKTALPHAELFYTKSREEADRLIISYYVIVP